MTRARTTRPGTVRFVGAGPGNAGMLTCRAQEVLSGNALVFADADVSAEVLALVAEGLTDAQVAERLVVSIRTVHAHLRSIYRKIDVRTRSAATRYALEHGVGA